MEEQLTIDKAFNIVVTVTGEVALKRKDAELLTASLVLIHKSLGLDVKPNMEIVPNEAELREEV